MVVAKHQRQAAARLFLACAIISSVNGCTRPKPAGMMHASLTKIANADPGPWQIEQPAFIFFTKAAAFTSTNIMVRDPRHRRALFASVFARGEASGTFALGKHKGARVSLSRSSTSAETMQAWTASTGTIAFTLESPSRLRVEIRDATMVPRRGEDGENDVKPPFRFLPAKPNVATGTFAINASADLTIEAR